MSEKPPEAREPIVLDREGHVVYEPASARAAKDAKAGGFSVSWGVSASGSRAAGVVPKLLFGVAFVALFAIGLTVAGFAIAAFCVGWIARKILGAGRS